MVQPASTPSLLSPDPADPLSLTFDVGAIFEREARRLLGDLVPPLPGSVDLQLTMASATPNHHGTLPKAPAGPAASKPAAAPAAPPAKTLGDFDDHD